MSDVLSRWNAMCEEEAAAEMLSICGAKRWAIRMAQARPMVAAADIFSAADTTWSAMGESDWLEAIACHPRIGYRKPAHATAQSQQWSRQEQNSAQQADEAVLNALANGNRAYEEKFGITYIVCATGKSAQEMLAILDRRLDSTREAELKEAAEQQRQITKIRLQKWLQSE
jgi:OHCU decarboxylase